jgi:hypothetical protein
MYSHVEEVAVVPPGVAVETAASSGDPASEAGGAMPDAQEGAEMEAPIATDPAPVVVRRPVPLVSFRSEMARAMQVVADRECERIDAAVGDEEIAQVEKIHVRASAEAAQLGKHADEDVGLVDAWYEAEVRRIREEADRRIDARRVRLERSLTHHGSLIAAEIQSVHGAVQGYRASLGAFFGRLAEEQDPGVIARLAGILPELPDLDDVRAEARSGAMKALEQRPSAEPPDAASGSSATGDDGIWFEKELVSVMDPDAVRQRVGILSGAAIPVVRPGPWVPPASQPSSSRAQSDVDVIALPPGVLSSEGHSPAPTIDSSTIWTSATGDPQGQ